MASPTRPAIRSAGSLCQPEGGPAGDAGAGAAGAAAGAPQGPGNLADPVMRVTPGFPAVFLRLVGFLFGQVGLFLRQVGLFLRQVGLPLGPVRPALRLLRRGPGLVGPPLRLLLLLLVSPLPGEVGGFGGHIGGVVRHHGRLVRPLGAFPGSFGPLPHLVGPLPLLVGPLPCAQPALVPGARRRPRGTVPVRDGFVPDPVVLAFDRVPGHAVGFAGLGHPLADIALPRPCPQS